MPTDEPQRGFGRSSDPAFRAVPSGKSWFFGIGINEYQHFPRLNNAVKDVKDILTLLLDQYGFQSDHVIVLYNEEATRENIIDELHQLVQKIGSEDRLLLYYSGHGHLDKTTNLAYWIPHDARQQRPSGYLSNSTVRDYVKSISSLHTLLISDSCFSGTFFARGANRSDIAADELERRRSRWGIVSGRHDEEVYDGAPGSNSPFAASILNVLSRNRGAKLNVARLADQVVEMTRSNYEQLPEGNPLFGVGHDGGQYIFRLVGSESNLWERCLAEHSLAAYNDYLDRFPNGSHADEALQCIQELEEENKWQKAQRIDQIYFYRSFLRSFPKGKYAAQASEQIRSLRTGEQEGGERGYWESVKAQDTKEAYTDYLKKYPQGQFLAQAEQRREQLAQLEKQALQEGQIERDWQQAKQRDDVGVYETFIKQHPKHRYAATAADILSRKRAEEKAWQQARQASTWTVFSDFIQQFPESNYVTEAQSRLKELKEPPSQERKAAAPSPVTTGKSITAPAHQKYLPYALGLLVLLILAIWLPDWGEGGVGIIDEQKLSLFQEEDGHRYGYQNSEGEIIVPARFDSAALFVANRALVMIDGQYGYINRMGVEIIPLQFDRAGSFTVEGEASVVSNGKSIYIDTTGTCIRNCPDVPPASAPITEKKPSDNKDKMYWESIKSSADLQDYKDYLAAFPQGEHRSEALKKINQIEAENSQEQAAKEQEKAWETALSQNTIVAFDRYLQKYPKGKYVIEATNIKTRLEEISRKKKEAYTYPNKGTITLKGQSYRTIQFKYGGLIWMAQNLKYDVTGSWCNTGYPEYCQKYGRLYTWESAKKACADLGWRLPTDQEWRDMAKNFGGADDDASDGGQAAYKALLEGGSSGFAAQLGGVLHPYDGFKYFTNEGYYWSATELGSASAWGYYFSRNKARLYRENYDRKFSFLCRCVQD